MSKTEMDNNEPFTLVRKLTSVIFVLTPVECKEEDGARSAS